MDLDINKNGVLPVYYQIQEQIKEQIRSGQLTPGTKLPSEREISNTIDVNRITVRRATQSLVSEGFCRRETGRGIFVAENKIMINLQALNGFSAFVRRLGKNPSSRVLSSRVSEADEVVSRRLMVSSRSPVLELKRVRLIDDEPMAIETTYLSLERFPGLDRYTFQEESLYELIEREYAVKADHSFIVFTVSTADEDVANNLGVPLSSPVIEKRSAVFSIEEITIEYVDATYRRDRFEFCVESRLQKADEDSNSDLGERLSAWSKLEGTVRS